MTTNGAHISSVLANGGNADTMARSEIHISQIRIHPASLTNALDRLGFNDGEWWATATIPREKACGNGWQLVAGREVVDDGLGEETHGVFHVVETELFKLLSLGLCVYFSGIRLKSSLYFKVLTFDRVCYIWINNSERATLIAQVATNHPPISVGSFVGWDS